MRETRLSGSEGGAGSIPVPTPIENAVARGRATTERQQPAI